MIFKDYFKKNRVKMFPWINDFSDPQDSFRLEKDVSKLSYGQWFWFHPTAFKTFHFGISAMAFFSFGLFGLLTLIYNKYLSLFLLIMSIVYLIDLIKKIIYRKTLSNITFYDLYVRDFENANH